MCLKKKKKCKCTVKKFSFVASMRSIEPKLQKRSTTIGGEKWNRTIRATFARKERKRVARHRRMRRNSNHFEDKQSKLSFAGTWNRTPREWLTTVSLFATETKVLEGVRLAPQPSKFRPLFRDHVLWFAQRAADISAVLFFPLDRWCFRDDRATSPG